MRFRKPLLFLLAALLLTLVACGRQAQLIPTRAVPPTTATTEAVAILSTATPAPAPRDSQAVSPISLPPGGTDDYPWWNDTVWYEVFVRSFYDSDADGVGDIQGLIQKLDYLNDGDPATTTDLGVTGIWLMPIMESPSYHGYDVVDYYAVDEEYGTEEDFLQLMEEAHKRGIRVIVDLVLNHTSSQHPWFQAARAGDETFEEWYVFAEGERPRQLSPWGSSTWHSITPDRHYYGIFWSEMPDLNYRNPAVTEEVENIMRFWVEEMGVDGFRLDAIRHLYETDGLLEHAPETHEWLEDYHTFFESMDEDGFIVGEVWSPTNLILPYIGDEIDLAFEFNTGEDLIATVRNELSLPIREAMAQNNSAYPQHQYAPFLTNHDQNRVFSQLGGNMEQMKMAASMLLTLPGTPFIYYGEEIAITGVKPDEDIRTPMLWSPGDGAGFTEAAQPWRRFSDNQESNNVETMDADPDSLLNLYRRLIALRNDHEALRIGAYLEVDPGNSSLYSFVRESDDETLLVLHNLSDEAISDYALKLEEEITVAEGAPPELLNDASIAQLVMDDSGGFSGYVPLGEVEPYSTYIIQLRP